ncbi:MAG TPA: hypothetical protein EYN96_09845 [Candidatus Hydrogenedentes bacterium]|nr:hypothetical protein [Candidatus Hydrogenedentota bacterium]
MMKLGIYSIVGMAILIAGCGSPRSSDDSSVPVASEMFLNMGFEERMAIRARLTVIDSEAKGEAAEAYDRFASREDAIAYEEAVRQLRSEKRLDLMQEHNLTDSDLTYIVNEYLQSRGVKMTE